MLFFDYSICDNGKRYIGRAGQTPQINRITRTTAAAKPGTGVSRRQRTHDRTVRADKHGAGGNCCGSHYCSAPCKLRIRSPFTCCWRFATSFAKLVLLLPPPLMLISVLELTVTGALPPVLNN